MVDSYIAGEASDNAPVRLVTRFDTVDAAAAGALAHRLHLISETVGDEPGNVDYTVVPAQDDALTLFVVETWATAADARRHENLVLSDGSVERIAPLMRSDMVTWRLRTPPGEPGSWRPTTGGQP